MTNYLKKKSSETQVKVVRLTKLLMDMGSVIVAYSGGVDSAFLAAISHSTLGDNSLAVTAKSPSLAPQELQDATSLAKRLNLNHRVIETTEIEREDYKSNNPNRCFFCKDQLYTQLSLLALNEGFSCITNGTNVDDLGDFRPGLNAAKKYEVRSPMVEVGLTKSEIRAISREMNLPTWDKPAQACLSSRIPYGTPVSIEALERIAKAEQFLRDLGLDQLRVRHHNNIARIEVEPKHFPLLTDTATRALIADHFKSIGYSYITLDLEGFRSGSLNETLSATRKITGRGKTKKEG